MYALHKHAYVYFLNKISFLGFVSGHEDIRPVEGAIISVFWAFGTHEHEEHSDIRSQECDQN